MSEGSILERLAFLDTAAGMTYCADMEDMYIEVLRMYAAQDMTGELSALRKDMDWEVYERTLHSLKSTSKTIGAAALSEKAMRLEQAAKKRDAAQVAAYHDDFLADYRRMLDQLRAVL